MWTWFGRGSAVTLVVTAIAVALGIPTSAAGAGPVIRCSLDLRQYPHYSHGDASWHATWKCDQAAYASGHLTLYIGNFPVANSGGTKYGVKGNYNDRSRGLPAADRFRAAPS
jgi:hypothetical protein